MERRRALSVVVISAAAMVTRRRLRRFWHATLRLRSAIRRHHPPQTAILSQICCYSGYTAVNNVSDVIKAKNVRGPEYGDSWEKPRPTYNSVAMSGRIPEGKNSLRICLAIVIQYMNMTNIQPARQHSAMPQAAHMLNITWQKYSFGNLQLFAWRTLEELQLS